jgi:succinate-semialdehyde dehydrogenase/glutarate-semialdehyde dehydrogenase
VPAAALELEQIFLDSGLPKGAFQTLLIGSGQVESVINDPRVKAVTLTGSEYAGSQVATTAGKALKKTVLELGGSDPFIVLKDADLDKVLDGAIAGRLINNGQSCIAAKRFIVSQELAEEFTTKLIERVKDMRIGDPSLEDTQLAPMVNAAGVEEIQAQVQAAVKSGAKLVYGGDKPAGLDPKLKNGFFINPAILTNVDSSNRVFAEETFGPVFAITTFKDEAEAVALANNSDLGLGSSIWTKDISRAEKLAAQIESGSVFINQQVRSDPRLPFGGIKKSGYGRELSYHGLREFVNVKTVFIAGK